MSNCHAHVVSIRLSYSGHADLVWFLFFSILGSFLLHSAAVETNAACLVTRFRVTKPITIAKLCYLLSLNLDALCYAAWRVAGVDKTGCPNRGSPGKKDHDQTRTGDRNGIT